MQITISKTKINNIVSVIEKRAVLIIAVFLGFVAVLTWYGFYENGLGLAYNDARSHLNIGRRVVEGLKPGLAQIGSVWLPLTHLLMVPTIWNDFMWHSGLSGALQSMIAFVATAVLVYLFLKELKTSLFARFFGVFLFVANLNVLYLQSTAMTELLLLATMTAGSYYLMLWAKKENVVDLIKSSGFIMLSTLVRYDGWFLVFFATLIVSFLAYRKGGFKTTEGTAIMFMTLGGVGIFLWFIWNLLIFGDPLYFAFGPFSAYSQQKQLLAAGDLPTKGNLLLSAKIYLYALFYNSYTLPALFGILGAFTLWINKKIDSGVRIASLSLLAPLIFNILALYLGHSVLFVQGISGETWFNVRYGVMLAPSIAIFTAYLVDKLASMRFVIVGLCLFVLFFAFAGQDAVTIDDATVGSSQKNVSEVSGWLRSNANDKKGFVLISAASHDAIIFSSGLKMGRFIHEGTGVYWEAALAAPDRWARYIVMRTNDENDLVFRKIDKEAWKTNYRLVDHYPFADIYELNDDKLDDLITEPVFGKQR